jgi:hypothetical protein
MKYQFRRGGGDISAPIYINTDQYSFDSDSTSIGTIDASKCYFQVGATLALAGISSLEIISSDLI